VQAKTFKSSKKDSVFFKTLSRGQVRREKNGAGGGDVSWSKKGIPIQLSALETNRKKHPAKLNYFFEDNEDWETRPNLFLSTWMNGIKQGWGI